MRACLFTDFGLGVGQVESEKPNEKRKKELQTKERADIVALGKDLFKSRVPIDVLSSGARGAHCGAPSITPHHCECMQTRTP